MSSLDYGDVPTWLYTALTLAIAVYAARTYRRAEHRQVRKQASQVHVASNRRVVKESDDEIRWSISATVINRSGAPIYDVWLHAHGRPGSEVFDYFGTLQPEEARSVEGVIEGTVRPAFETPVVTTSFRDADGYKWQRWENGRLMPPVDMRPCTGWRRLVFKVVPDRLLRAYLSREGRPPIRGD